MDGVLDGIMDVDQQPPYVEIYSDAPLMCASLVNARQAMASSSPTELAYWSHGVQCSMDDIATTSGLYKIKVLSDSHTCLFAISPDMPPRQQAEVMLHAAQQLRDVLSQVRAPGGDSLAAKVTIHAGKYAGAVVGRSAWTYDLFGEDVQLLLDMDRANSAGCILVSEAALNLISSRSGQFTPVCKVLCDGRNMQMHAWTHEEGSTSGSQTLAQQVLARPQQQQQQQQQQQPAPQGPASPASRVQLSSQQVCVPDVQPASLPQRMWQVQQHQSQDDLLLQPPVRPQLQPEVSAAIASAQRAVNSTQPRAKWHSAGAGTASTSVVAADLDEATSSGAMQPNLRFFEPVLESAYMETQGRPLAHMDLLFIVVNVAVTMCYVWTSSSMGSQAGSSSSLQLVLSACCHWGLLPVAAVWLLASPGSYGRWRETLWVVHRVVSALQVAVLVLLSSLPQQGLLLGPGTGPVGAAAAAALTAAGSGVTRGALGLHKGKALALLAENLGLKVRFHVHMLTNTFTCALVTLSTLWFYTSSSDSSSSSNSGNSDSTAGLPLWDLLQHLLLGWAAPTMLTYLWELDDRLKFLDALEAQRNKAAEPPVGKCKDV